LQAGTNTIGSSSDNSLHLPASAPAHVAVIEQIGSGPSAKLRLSAPKEGFPSGFTISGVPAAAGDLPQTAKWKFGTYTALIISRGDKLGLRVKDENAATRKEFQGLNWYRPDTKYRVKARWIPYTPAHDINVPTIIGTVLHEKVPGAAEFMLNGKRLRLEPIVEENKLFFILRDTTSRTTTYGAARFLYTDLPVRGLNQLGELTMDFNRLTNPPCAYTPYATCPLPPEQNRLDVAIAAGEKRYHE
jgi:uncharacterized protein (DUF1684 family)